MLDFNYGVLFVSFAVLLFSLTVHEAAHAWAADRLGDPTARRLGRLSLNPVVHVDPIGTLLLPLVALVTSAPVIGWAKPVPVNRFNLANHRRDFLLIAAAGPASNLLLALVASLTVRFWRLGLPVPERAGAPLLAMLALLFQLNLLLAIFNMVPVPPLDGGNVLAGLLPEGLADRYDRVVRPYGVLILYGLLLTGALGYVIWPPYEVLAWLLRP